MLPRGATPGEEANVDNWLAGSRPPAARRAWCSRALVPDKPTGWLAPETAAMSTERTIHLMVFMDLSMLKPGGLAPTGIPVLRAEEIH